MRIGLAMHIIKNQSGSVLLIALLVLMAITVIGTMSIRTSVVELHISRNEREARETFFLAESAAVEGSQRLVYAIREDLEDEDPIWYHSRKNSKTEKIDFRKPDRWHAGGQAKDNCIKSSMVGETYISCVEWDVATGGSLVMTESRLYINRIYGLCRKYQADDIIEIGYAMRY
jgi:hypothetical protein